MTARWIRAAILLAATGAAPAVAAPGDPGWQAFLGVASVLHSPRCVSCHIPGDAPLQGDDGHRHVMNVKRGADGRGTPALRCTACHQGVNSSVAHAPPGAPDWRLPPPGTPMAWLGMGPEALCAALKDPARTGGRGLAALEDHLRTDPLVGWGFNPGPGRRPPPLSRDELVARFAAWRAAGAPCAAQGGSDAR
jgi:hypothetical protein